MTSEQLSMDALLAESQRLRDEGIAKVEGASDDWDRAVVDRVILEVAARGVRFSANDCRPLFPPDIRPALLGARFLAAAKAGRITKVGYTPSTDKGTHSHPIAEWISTSAAAQEQAA